MDFQLQPVQDTQGRRHEKVTLVTAFGHRSQLLFLPISSPFNIIMRCDNKKEKKGTGAATLVTANV